MTLKGSKRSDAMFAFLRHRVTALLLASAALLVSGSNLGFAQSKHSFAASSQPQNLAQPGFPANVRWEGGWFVGIEANGRSEPILYRIDWNGRSERIPFAIPDAGHIWIEEVSSGADGALGVIGVAYATDGKAGTFVARVAADRQRQIVTRVWPYCPKVLTFAADNTMWTAGYVLNEAGYISQGNVLRQYDESGRLVRSVTVRADSQFPGDGASSSFLRASRERIAWLTNKNEYIEFLPNGSESLRIAGPPLGREHPGSGRGFALSEGGQAVLGASAHTGRLDLWVLDRESRMWIPIAIEDLEPAGKVLGFDGEELVASHGNFRIRRYKESLRSK